ncbi:MAG: NAD(P)H-dependent oxidoreductase [Bacteroidota bacterium]
MSTSPIIILGSARSDGSTRKMVDFIAAETAWPIIDLKSKRIEYFDYSFNNQDDDFIPLMEHILNKHDLMLCATPVYWYSMSAIMKNFFDRMTDLLKVRKDLGAKLPGKQMAMLSCGSDEEWMESMRTPFEEGAKYLGMRYLGDVHTWLVANEIPIEIQEKIRLFIQEITSPDKSLQQR